MLEINDAADVIYQLKTKPFLCSDDLISTNDYIILKKTGNITTDSIMRAIRKIKKEGKRHERN